MSGTDVLERLERQAAELGALREHLRATNAMLAGERKQRQRLEAELAKAAQDRERLEQASVALKRERESRRAVEEDLVRAEEEIDALRTEVDHAWVRLRDQREEAAPERGSRWRRLRGSGPGIEPPPS